MKKQIISAILIGIASFANAAAVSWSVTGITAPGTTTKTANYAAYLFQSDKTGYSSVQEALANGTFASMTSKALASGMSTAVGVITKSEIGSYGASATVSAPENITFYMVIFDSNEIANATNYILSNEKTVSFTSASGTKSVAFTNIVTSTEGGWTAIPEPTSGLLLLIGVAGLALKRKRV